MAPRQVAIPAPWRRTEDTQKIKKTHIANDDYCATTTQAVTCGVLNYSSRVPAKATATAVEIARD
jgi:hypothetical protein